MRELFRGAVFLHILHHAAVELVHGAWTSAESATHGYDNSPGTPYPVLHRMNAYRLLISQRSTINGRVLWVYRAAEAGEAALAAGWRVVRELADEVLPHDETGQDDDQ